MAILAASTLYRPAPFAKTQRVTYLSVTMNKILQSCVVQTPVAQLSYDSHVLVQMQAKVKLVADAVWSKLTGVFVNDVLHVQVGPGLPHLLWILYITPTQP